MSDDGAPAKVRLTDGLGQLAGNRRGLRSGATVTVWGCIVCSNVWMVNADRPLEFVIAAVWLAFAALVLWIEHDAQRA